MEDKKLEQSFEQMLNNIYKIRRECPWDAEQTPESLRTLTIEETYELAQSILTGNHADFKKELGDVLLHIILYARIAEERGWFSFADVCDALNDKLVFRHPHIFGDVKAETPEEVSKMWEQVKLKEKGGNKTVLSGIPDALPALIKAYRIQYKARNAGFDWDERKDVWPKVQEELGELQTELEKNDKAKSEQEFGDVLFAVINAGRLYDINPDTALELTNRKFINRFNYIEQKAKEQGRKLKDMTLAEMEQLWQQAKTMHNA